MKPDEADQAANPKAARQRRFWSAEEKRRIVAESFTPGASVSKVAQRYGLNANLLFGLAASGRNERGSRRRGAVAAIAGDGSPTQKTPTARAAASEPVGRLEIVPIVGERIVVGADVDGSSLARVVKALSRR